MRKIVVGIGGSSGSIYGKLLLDCLQIISDIEVGVVFSKNAKINWELEMSTMDLEKYTFKFYENNDFFAPFASGSAKFDTMIVCPSSMGLLARIAQGISDDLMTRAADVMLKERRKLILVPREAPYNLIHLRNMTSLTEAGAIICPASPSFYSKPTSLEEVALTVVHRILNLADLEVNSFEWGK